MLTPRIIRKLYPRDPKHIRNKSQCDRNMRTSNASEEKRYWMINPVHVGVKLLDKHERTGHWDVTQWLPSLTVTDRGKVGVGKVRQNDLAFWMNASSWKVLENALKASSLWNRIWDREGSDEEEAPERRGFQVGVDLCLGAIDMTNVNGQRGRERMTIRKVPNNSNITNILKRSTYAWEMHEHVTCKRNCIMGSAQSKPINTQTDSAHLNAWQYHYNANVMQCMRF